jgi:hypothetical protein
MTACGDALNWLAGCCQAGRLISAVRYFSTPAGRVAYSVTGTGPPLLCETGWVSHVRCRDYGRGATL